MSIYSDEIEERLFGFSQRTQNYNPIQAEQINYLINSIGADVGVLLGKIPDYLLTLLMVLTDQRVLAAKAKIEQFKGPDGVIRNTRLDELNRSLIVAEGIFIQEALPHKSVGPRQAGFSKVVFEILNLNTAS